VGGTTVAFQRLPQRGAALTIARDTTNAELDRPNTVNASRGGRSATAPFVRPTRQFDGDPAAIAILRHRLSAARAITFSTIALYATLLRLTSLPDMHLIPVLCLAAVEVALLVPFRAWLARGQALRLLLAATFALDFVVGTLAFIAVPQLPIVFHMLYLLVIVPAALTSTSWGLITVVLASGCHVALLLGRPDAGPIEFVGPIVLFLLSGQQSVFYGRRIAAIAHNAATESKIAAALLRVAHELATAASSTVLPQRVAELAYELSGAEWTIVMIRDPTRGSYRVAGIVTRTGIANDEILTAEFPAGTFPDAVIAGSAEGCTLIDEYDAVMPAWLRTRWRVGSFLAVTLRHAEEPFGLLFVGSGLAGIDEPTRRLLVGIADQTVLALDHARVLEDLRTASALKTEFMGTMSHELRSPLNAILGYVEMLVEEDGEPGTPTRESRRTVLQRVNVHALQLLEMITATLDVSRLESGRLPITRGAVDLDALVADLRTNIPAYWRKPPVALEWRYDALPRIETDAAKVKTILRNLIHNALKFTEHGRVVVSLGVRPTSTDDDPTHGVLTVVVTDTGVGIPSDCQALIFEMFRQGDGSDSRRHGGVGLGLYIVRRLVQALGGTIRLDSTEGTGSTFDISLPVLLLDATAAPTTGAMAWSDSPDPVGWIH
jgi:signal transduction histidine kinase